MMNRLALLTLLGLALGARGDEASVKAALGKSIIGPRQALLDLQEHLDARLPKLPEAKMPEQWEKVAAKLRQDLLDRVVLRGEAQKWAKAKCKVELVGTLSGGEGYKVRTLRYEALPGMWILALLEEGRRPLQDGCIDDETALNWRPWRWGADRRPQPPAGGG